MINIVDEQLKAKYPTDIVEALIKSYTEMKENFHLGKFKPSELEGGFFVECVRRILEIELFNTTIPIGKNLNNFNDVEMRRYENAGTGDEAFRLHIPRMLRSIYNLRNKRGVGHLSLVGANIMDSTYIVSSCDWIIAEILRQVSTIPPEECQRIIDSIVQKKLPVIFEDGETQRVLDHRMNKRNQVILLLYYNSQPIEDTKLCKWVEYSSLSMFKARILRPLHSERFIEYRQDGYCVLTPKGIAFTESIA